MRTPDADTILAHGIESHSWREPDFEPTAVDLAALLDLHNRSSHQHADHAHEPPHECERCGKMDPDAVGIDLPTGRDEPPDGYYLCQSCADERDDARLAAEEWRAERRAELYD